MDRRGPVAPCNRQFAHTPDPPLASPERRVRRQSAGPRDVRAVPAGRTLAGLSQGAVWHQPLQLMDRCVRVPLESPSKDPRPQ